MADLEYNESAADKLAKRLAKEHLEKQILWVEKAVTPGETVHKEGSPCRCQDCLDFQSRKLQRLYPAADDPRVEEWRRLHPRYIRTRR